MEQPRAYPLQNSSTSIAHVGDDGRRELVHIRGLTSVLIVLGEMSEFFEMCWRMKRPGDMLGEPGIGLGEGGISSSERAKLGVYQITD